MRGEGGAAAGRHEQELLKAHAESYPTAFDEAVARRNGLIFPITEEPPLSRAPSQEGDHVRQGGIAGGQKQRDAGREAGSGARQDVGVEQSAKPVASVLLAGAAAREGFFPGQSGVGWGVGMHIPGSGGSPAHAQQSAQRGVAGGQTRYWQMQEELRQRCVAFALVLQCQACVQSKGFCSTARNKARLLRGADLCLVELCAPPCFASRLACFLHHAGRLNLKQHATERRRRSCKRGSRKVTSTHARESKPTYPCPDSPHTPQHRHSETDTLSVRPPGGRGQIRRPICKRSWRERATKCCGIAAGIAREPFRVLAPSPILRCRYAAMTCRRRCVQRLNLRPDGGDCGTRTWPGREQDVDGRGEEGGLRTATWQSLQSTRG